MGESLRPVVAACNLIAEGETVVLVGEAKPSARGRYNLPAGKVEAGETLIAAAEREALEETGLKVKVESLLGIYHCLMTSEGFAVLNFVFESRVLGGALATSNDHPEVRYYPIEEIERLGDRHLLRGTHILQAIAAYRAQRRLPLDLVEVLPPSPLPIDMSTT